MFTQGNGPVPDLSLAMLSSVPDEVWAVDRQYRIAFLNPAFEQTMTSNYALRPVIGSHSINLFRERFGPTLAGNLREYYDRAFAGETFTITKVSEGPETGIYREMQFFPIRQADIITGAGVISRDVTERMATRQRAEKALEENQLKFELVSAAINDMLWDWDIIQNKIIWSQGFVRLFGLPTNGPDYTIEQWEAAVHPDDRARVVNGIMAAIASGNVLEWQDEYRMIGTDGQIIYVIDQGRLVRDAQGQALRMVGGLHNVTQLKKQQLQLEEALVKERQLNAALAVREEELATREEELTSSEEELRQLNDQLLANCQLLLEKDFLLRKSHQIARIGSWEYDLFSNRINWSEELYRILQLPADFEPSLAQIKKILGNDNSQAFTLGVRQLLAERDLLDLTIQCQNYHGEAMWLHLTGYTLRENGQINRIIGLAQDVTELKQTEFQLRSSEEKFSKTFDLSPDIVTLLREDDLTIVEANQRAAEVLRVNKEELIGFSTMVLDLWGDPDKRNVFMEQYRLHGTAAIESWLKRKGRPPIYALIQARQIEIAGTKYMLTVSRDISDRHQAEEKIRNNELNLSAIINNTDMSIWSIDRQYRVIAFNRICYEDLYRDFGFIMEKGKSMLDEALPDLFTHFWKPLYDRALAGEQFRLVEKTPIGYYEFSLNPIIADAAVTGVAIYANNVTSHVEQEEKIRQSSLELAEANKKLADLKMMALRSVMNPHFIFNSLNSIQYMVSSNDRTNAIRYLAFFSKLIRGVLQHSVQNKIRLADEIQLLRYYVSLELIRFEEKFDAHFDIAEEVDAENIEIPSLLIQPFVENAILHGLYNKEGKGNLRISVSEHSNDLVFVVEDDGVGRQAATEIRQRSFSGHKSMGMIITQERLALLNQERTISIQVEDLFKGEHPAGTRVTIRLALG